jgi:aminopeptidase YwaD
MRAVFTLLLPLLVFGGHVTAQKKADRKVAKQLQADISYLASDELQGRRTGTEGEKKAADYIEQWYRKVGIEPYKDQYRYPFKFTYGREIAGTTVIRINNTKIRVPEDAFPLPFTANKHVASEILPDVMEQDNIWLVPLYTEQEQAADKNFNAEKYMFEHTKEAMKQGATAVIFYDGFGGRSDIIFNSQSLYEPLEVPVVFLNYSAYQKYIKPADGASGQKGTLSLDLDIAIRNAERTGTNLAAYIDNGAPFTAIIGAHYDHLGYGEDGNSLFANAQKEHQIHHGADDNASGTAAVLEVAKWVKHKKLRNYNYLFLNFSGEELGLYGSKAFVKDQQIDSARIAYMINLDMVGRLNDSTHKLELGGVGTSPAWADVVSMGNDNFRISIDSSGTGPSDHTSFYNAGIPVLFFFTGQHKDYHKPSDKADAINYNGEVQVINYVDKVVATIDKEDVKPPFTPTKQKSVGKTAFKVTLGIMPDYSFQEGGVRVDGVSDNRPAMRAGIKQGDVIIKLGEYKIGGMQSYMDALGKFNPGDKTQVTLNREGKELVLPIVLTGKQ